MIAINKTLISEDLLDKKFVCDLNACKGACCVAGDSGAPLEKEELQILESILDKVKPYMVKKGIKAIEKFGAYVIDGDGDYTTTLVSPGAECAFVFFDDNKIAKCSIEQAYYDGKITWKKPISCHLYPVRITKHKEYDAVNYDKWDICKPACECGAKLDVPVYKFLKEPLIRKYGKDWFKQLEISAKLFLKK
ncbi:MAG: DUF3109 family protein [Bacteroidota bacterium]|nr:DUF3109 family protein [Bacteroidota bacterium]MDP3143990.1 DUF3109 family protein [Bacteroidota bacterium]